MTALFVLLGLVAFLIFAGLVESILHRKNLERIPIRVHVNGTRGKSSVTRLIAAGLRGGGVRTFAKTTGTLPRLILPDGGEVPVMRNSRPNVIEQRAVIRAAARGQAQAVVVECMALQPWLQWISESKLIRATHGVITNARADHLDVMGPDESHVALALANMTPRQGVLFTAEHKHRGILKRAAQDRGSRLAVVSPRDMARVTYEELSRFSYAEHRENVALALMVCCELGVDRDAALAAMCDAAPDPGATATYELEFCGREIHFVSAFAANDPTSTERIWRQALQEHPRASRRVALFNCRSDRADRSRQLAQACVDWPPADHYVLTGNGTSVFIRFALKAGLDPRRIVVLESCDISDLFESLIDLAGPSAVIVGMGNIGNNGLDIARFFRNRCFLPVGEPVEQFARPTSQPSQELELESELQPIMRGDLEREPPRNGKPKNLSSGNGRY